MCADGMTWPVTLRALAAAVGRRIEMIWALASRQAAASRSFRNFRAFGAGWLNRLHLRLHDALALATQDNAATAA